MNNFRALFMAAGLALLSSPLSAEALSSDDNTALQTRIDVFNAAFRDADFEEVMTAMPPRMLTFIAESAGVEESVLLSSMIEQTKAAMQTVTVDSFEMSLADATSGVTDAGNIYAIVPTSTRMTVENVGKVQGSNSTLALKDEGKWYLIRVDNEQQLQLLRAVYPGFADVEFPIGTMQVVE